VSLQRRIEARIGQLLGEHPGHGPGRGEKDRRAEGFSDEQRNHFRYLAKGFIEARIGQLLGEHPGHGPGRGDKSLTAVSVLNDRQRNEFRYLAKGFGCLTLALLSACATIAPDALRLEAGHQSSALQHLESPTHNYGMETLGAVLVWRRGRWVTEVSEAAVIGTCLYCPARDVFDARVGYEIPLR
jgi:hypothetical protein